MVGSASWRGSIHLSFYDWEGRSEILQTLNICQESILRKKLVTFDYIDKDGMATNRIIEPYQLHFSEMSWYLKGFCLHRQSYRTFKLSRIDNFTMDEHTFNPRDYLLEQKQKTIYQSQLVTMKALIAPSIKDQFIERYGRKSIENYSTEYLLATIYVPQNSTGFRFLASFGTNLEILEPKTYVEQFRSYLNLMIHKYS